MIKGLKKMVIDQLRDVADKIDSNSCEISDEQAMDIFRVIAHEPLSKEQACDFLNISRSNFDGMVREGKLPKGRKVKGYKELRWYKDELILS